MNKIDQPSITGYVSAHSMNNFLKLFNIINLEKDITEDSDTLSTKILKDL